MKTTPRKSENVEAQLIQDLGGGLSTVDSKMSWVYEAGYQDEVAITHQALADTVTCVLVVDDDYSLRNMLQNYFHMMKVAHKGVGNACEALEVLRRGNIDLVVCDINMPGKDGVELMQEARQEFPDIPFIIMTGFTPGYSYEAIIDAGASDFIAKPFSLGELKAKICRIQKEQNTLRQLQQMLAKVQKLFENTVGALASTLEKRDPYTAGHQNRVGDLASAIGRELGFSEDRIGVLRLAAYVHDIGKMGVPTDILTKPGKLTEIEMSLIKVHCQVGYDILKNVEFPWPIAEMVYQHHERMNGRGYPRGLQGPDILLEARILAVADVVEAMSAHRPYRPALELSAALEEISLNRGILYDGQVADACLRLFTEKDFKFGKVMLNG